MANQPPINELPNYIPYLKALKRLSDRLSATPEEIAAWVWLGPDQSGLAAFLNANELEPPPRFYFDYYMGEDYVSALMASWFLADVITSFQPADRYITGSALRQRWSDSVGVQVDAYIHAKIAEDQLHDIHPTMGLTQWSEGQNAPPKETALFSKSEVEAIEREEFADEKDDNAHKAPGHLNYDLVLQTRANQIAADKQKRMPKKMITKGEVARDLAAERGIRKETVERRIRKEWK